jgi:hypothetical protein
MTTATVIESSRRRRPIVGERVELGRYTITAGTRVHTVNAWMAWCVWLTDP